MDILEKIADLVARTGHVFIATADGDGLPHLAAARRLRATPDGRLWVTEWFCPGTMANLEHNRRISLVVWDHTSDVGYQILGQVEDIREMAVLDGFTPAESMHSTPQVAWELVVRVDSTLSFRQAPHTDRPL
jgi:general stress protein 26